MSPRQGGALRHGNPLSMRGTGEAGFSLVEILAAIMVFTLVFLAGFAGIGRLLLTQDQVYARTIAASAAMLITDWHHRRQMAGPTLGMSITDTSLGVVGAAGITDRLLTLIPPANLANIEWKGADYAWSASNAPSVSDNFYVFNNTPAVLPSGTTALDLAQTPGSFSEYDSLLVCVSPPSIKEADSKLTFRQLSFWFAPPQIIRTLRTGADPNRLVLVGRYVIADTFIP